jgi:adenosylcobinamide-GDP ribazoletransferase
VRFIAAFRFLTVIPLPTKREATGEETGGSVVYFPLVGLIIGLFLAVLHWLLSRILPFSLASALVIAALALTNGALHLDGFIDTCDGLAGNKTAEERWRVMRDSRVGAFGVVGGVLLLLLKYVSLASIPRDLVPASLIVMPVASRWLMTFAIVAYPYARPTGLGSVFKQHATWEKFGVATFFALLVLGTVLWWRGVPHFYAATLVIMAGTWLVAFGWTQYLNRKFAGLTGDSYGAVNEFSEVVILIVVGLLAFNHWLWVA